MSTITKPDCYVGIMPCGCYVAVVMDRPEYRKETAKTIAQYIQNGYRIEPAILEEVRHKLGKCKCPNPQTELAFS